MHENIINRWPHMIYQIQNHIGIKILKDLGNSKQKMTAKITKTVLVLFKVKTQANLLHASG